MNVAKPSLSSSAALAAPIDASDRDRRRVCDGDTRAGYSAAAAPNRTGWSGKERFGVSSAGCGNVSRSDVDCEDDAFTCLDAADN
jgi:hypothetical protein